MSIRPLERIADDAVEAVSYGREQTQWLAALAAAIRLDLKHGKVPTPRPRPVWRIT